MSTLAEETLVAHLTDVDSLHFLAQEGIRDDVIPTAELRPVVRWAVDYYSTSGMPPSPEAMLTEWGDAFGDYLREQGITLGEPEDSIQWAVTHLKSSYVTGAHGRLIREHATQMAEADPGDQPKILDAHIEDLLEVSRLVQRHDRGAGLSGGAQERVQHFIALADRDATIQGLAFGLGLVDDYTGGIWEGELAVCAGGPKSGKSFYAVNTALREWQRGRRVALMTLELSVDTMLDRLVCIGAGVDPSRWQRGKATDDEIARVQAWLALPDHGEERLHVLQPPAGQRTPYRLVREAQLYGVDSVIIDQLSYMEDPDPHPGKPRYIQIREMMHDLREALNSGAVRTPCLLMHQISRDGVASARKAGRLEMEFLAEGSEIERTADWVFGLHQSGDEREARMMKLQALAARREDLRHFYLAWDLGVGHIDAVSPLTLETA